MNRGFAPRERFMMGRLFQVSCRVIASVFLVVLVGMASGCATAPPVQEMSDARQAIAAAREAGAETLASDRLTQAQSLLDGAEEYLELGTAAAYWQAKKNAINAKEVAFEALLTTRDAKDAAAGRSR